MPPASDVARERVPLGAVDVNRPNVEAETRAAGRRALKPLYPTDLINNINISTKRAPNQKPIRYRVTGTPRVDRMSSSPQPNTMLPYINAAFKDYAPSSTPAGPTAPISMQPVYDSNPFAPLADAPEDPPTITTGTGAGASRSSIEFPPLRKRVRDPAATSCSSAPTSPAKTPKSKKPGEFILIFICAIRQTDDV